MYIHTHLKRRSRNLYCGGTMSFVSSRLPVSVVERCYVSRVSYGVTNVSGCCVFEASEVGYQEEADGAVRPREVRGPASDGAVASVLAIQRRRQHMELRDSRTDQEIRGEPAFILREIQIKLRAKDVLHYDSLHRFPMIF